MSRYERRMFFESLCQLRDRYAARPSDDRAAVISIEDAIASTEAELLREPVPDVVPVEEQKT